MRRQTRRGNGENVASSQHAHRAKSKDKRSPCRRKCLRRISGFRGLTNVESTQATRSHRSRRAQQNVKAAADSMHDYSGSLQCKKFPSEMDYYQRLTLVKSRSGKGSRYFFDSPESRVRLHTVTLQGAHSTDKMSGSNWLAIRNFLIIFRRRAGVTTQSNERRKRIENAIKGDRKPLSIPIKKAPHETMQRFSFSLRMVAQARPLHQNLWRIPTATAA